MGVRSLGYLRLESNDIEAWKVFGGDFLGMMRVEGGDPESLYFRIDHYPPRLVVTPAAEPAMTAMGFEVLNRRELAQLVGAIEAAGIKVDRRHRGGVRRAAGHRVRPLRRPGRQPGRAVLRPDPRPRPVQTPTVSAFVTGDMGMGHVIVTAEDARGGSTTSTPACWASWSATRWPAARCASSAATRVTTRSASPPAAAPASCCTSCWRSPPSTMSGWPSTEPTQLGIPMMHTLGKHTNDHMVSFYVWSPERYAIEFGWNGLRVTTRSRPTRSRRARSGATSSRRLRGA